MTLDYTVSEDGLVQANYELSQTPEGKRLWKRLKVFRLVGGTLIGMLLWLMWSLMHLPTPGGVFLWAAAGAALFGLVLHPALRRFDIRQSLRRVLKDGKGIVGPRQLELTPEGITVRSQTGVQTFFWSSVEGLVETEAYLYSRNSKIEYLLIPKTAFASPQHLTEFCDTFERLREGQGQAVPPQKQAWYQSKENV